MKRTKAIKKIHTVLKTLTGPEKVQVLQAVASLHSEFYVEESS